MKSCPHCALCSGDRSEVCPADGHELVEEIAGSDVIDGRYAVKARLGHGGMGVIYRVRHEGVQRDMALKLIRPDVDTDATFLARFRLEAEALGRLKHRGIVDVTDFGVD